MTSSFSDHFALEGWVRIRNLISTEEVSALCSETEALIKRGHPDRSGDSTFQYGPHPGNPGRYSLFRINDLLVIHNLERVRLLLGNPKLLGAVSQLVGDSPFVSSTETLLFKLPNNGFGVRWHQDEPPIRFFPSIMAAVYLDRSIRENGALQVLPRSHLAGYIGAEEWIYSQTAGPFGLPSGTVVVEAEPGDVVFHATTLLHCSPWSEHESIRRTIYFHFNSFNDVRLQPSNGWTRVGYLSAQQRLVTAITARRVSYPYETPFIPLTVEAEALR
jgi:ectoine hydroxylase-related dioxygenase (phytanoyl-CoA dioxygenase family)